eukprot:TRINITY_DN1573_c0_g1_i1.p1 TRINITY_DN1573_c0_g1~~TRINITY_DN1573_c0_g1_i1.p1  ORF type:complete len:249 (-),score=53.24 TRINITY_DN1573_c0_g1_i1:24-770(-)
MNYLFVTEFVEIHSYKRTKLMQGGGVHGNAILSVFPLEDIIAGTHAYQPYSWEGHISQPRRGGRAWVGASIVTPDGVVRCYSLHLEVFCGIAGRVNQLMEVMEDAEVNYNNGIVNQIIGGDFNTVCHGFFRYLPITIHSLPDLKMRWNTMGTSEQQWFQTNVFNEPVNEPVLYDDNGDVCQILPIARRFNDPFDIDVDYTFSIIWQRGKIDWILSSHLQVQDYHRGDPEILGSSGLSDHLYLYVEYSI